MIRRTRIVVRIVKSPVAARGEVLVVLPESRQFDTHTVVAYAIAREAFFTEDLRRLMDRTRAADPHTAAEARRTFEYVYGEPVVLARKANAYGDRERPPTPDEPPAEDDGEDE
jgi:hypothetical protein